MMKIINSRFSLAFPAIACFLAVGVIPALADDPPAASSADKPKIIAPPPLPVLSTAKRSMIEEDPRLKRSVTLSMRDQPVSDLLAKLTEFTAVKLEPHPDIVDRNITVVVRGVPVVNLMAHLGYLMDWGWQRMTQKDEISYRLQPQAGMRRRAQRIRDSIINTAISERAIQEWQKAQPALDAWIDSGGDIDAVREADPSLAEVIRNDPNLEYRLSAMAAMPPAARYNWFVQQIREAGEVRGPDVSYTLVKQYLTDQTQTVGSVDPAFDKKISIKLPTTATLSAALEAFSKLTHLNIVADSYVRKANIKTSEWKETPVRDILDSIANDTEYSWLQSSNFIRFRNRTWFLDELRDVPESVIRPWKELKEKQGRLAFDDLVALTSHLTDDQLAGLAESGERYSLSREAGVILRYLLEFRFFAGMSSSQRQAAWSEGGISMARMSRAQQQAFLRLISLDRQLTPPYWESAVFFFIRQRGSQGYEIVFSYNVEDKMQWDHRILLPMTQPKPAVPPPTTAETPSPAP